MPRFDSQAGHRSAGWETIGWGLLTICFRNSCRYMPSLDALDERAPPLKLKWNPRFAVARGPCATPATHLSPQLQTPSHCSSSDKICPVRLLTTIARTEPDSSGRLRGPYTRNALYYELSHKWWAYKAEGKDTVIGAEGDFHGRTCGVIRSVLRLLLLNCTVIDVLTTLLAAPLPRLRSRVGRRAHCARGHAHRGVPRRRPRARRLQTGRGCGLLNAVGNDTWTLSACPTRVPAPTGAQIDSPTPQYAVPRNLPNKVPLLLSVVTNPTRSR
ncbi:hypothetical protein B0H11DRAFT_2242951 [Mycena galericulata]|nr:hypothetical protein B0H11DRAFT_2242951 [Mycena galericulata]